MAREVQICPHCGAGIIGSPSNCPRCDFQLNYDAAQQVMAPAEAEPPSFEPDLLETVAAPNADTPAFENAQTAPVDPQIVGVTALPSTLAETHPKTAPPPPALLPIPPAPYTPPPLREATVSVAPYSYPSNYYLEQRVAAYRSGGYEMVNYTPYQVTMSHGKSLSFFWWIIAMLSGIGLIWYWLILLTSGFSKDRVYLIVERSGTLYEDGAGAAHIRRQRAVVGRRWGFVGVIIFFTSLIWFGAMVGLGVWGMQQYGSELEAAYPSVSLFVQDDSSASEAVELTDEAIRTAESLVLAYSVLFALALICLFIGLALTVVGYLHSAAYEVRVMPLPSYK